MNEVLARFQSIFLARARLVASVFVVFACFAFASTGQARAETVVSLTFDDGIATQYNLARPLLASHGMHGTFFINSGNVGTDPYFMSWSDIDALAAAGNEIGGHTVSHKRLTTLPPDEQRHQICDDAATLRAHGYTVTDFAYPFGAGSTSPTVRAALIDCGFLSARKYGDLRGPDCTDCPYAETIPPHDPYALKTGGFQTGPLTLQLLEDWVTQAEDHGGGWVPIVFHDICDGCDDSSVSEDVFRQFLDWLQPRSAQGTVIETVREVIAGTPPLIQFQGILGLDKVKVAENGFGELRGRIGSNGNFTLKACKKSGSTSQILWDPGPDGKLSSDCAGAIQTASPARTTDWTLDPVDGLIGNPNTADPSNNDNAAVFSSAPGFAYAYDPATGIRDLKDTADSTLVLDGPNPRAGSNGIWTFNFCKVDLTHRVTITLRGDAIARFFIDSSDRPGSQCAAKGSLTISNVSYLNYDQVASAPGDPTLLQYYVDGHAKVAITNQSRFAAELYAPLSDVKFTNKTVWYGAIAAKSVEATNGLDFYPGN